MDQTLKSIAIIQVQVNGLRSRLNKVNLLIEKYECQNKLPVLLLNDIRLNSNIDLIFKNHVMIRRDHPSNRSTEGGVAIRTYLGPIKSLSGHGATV